MCCSKLLALLFLSLLSIFGESRVISRDATNLETSSKSYDHKNIVPNTDTSKSHHAPKKWAVLVAGSQGYINYRHQADVCHAYQILKNGGLKDENIIVFMYDDIAFNEDNPRPGVIINHPRGSDVYEGVPKDYIKEDANVDNLFAVILGNKTALKGGSGKVVDSGPEDSIFIYYSDHGGSGVVDMPSGRAMYATDFVHVLKKKHATKSFKSMVIYMEACEAGSMFEGLLPNNLNIYTITASNANESSYGTYCSGIPEYDGTCLGDFFSISWMEDSDKHDPEKETLEQQFKLVKRRIAYDSTDGTSHAMQYGDLKLQKQFLSVYMGRNHMNNNYSIADDGFMTSSPISHVVDQYDADLIHFKSKYARAPEGSHQKLEAQRQLLNEISCREHVQQSIAQIGKLLLDDKDGSIMRNSARPQGSPVVDDWDRFKLLVKTYEKHCGRLSGYGMKYTRAIANMCNFGVQVNEMAKASLEACHARPRNSCKTIWDN